MNSVYLIFVLTALTLGACKSSEKTTGNASEKTEASLAGGAAGTETDQNGYMEEPSDENQTRRMTGRELVGEWEWVKTSCCGRTARDIFPEPGEDKKVIAFSADGRARYFSGDEAKTLVDLPFSIGELGTQTTVRIGELQPALFWVEGDDLSLSWGYMDLQTEFYRRVK